MSIIVIVIYALVIFGSTTLGACAGLGGGIIIKPTLDYIHFDSTDIIGFYSANAVFAMSCRSSIKAILSKHKFNWNLIILIAISSMAGGYLGNLTFNILYDGLGNRIVTLIQSGLLCFMILLLIAYFIHTPQSYSFKNPLLIIFCGIFLGLISAFLSIGGGPANVVIYSWLFGLTLKESIIYSLATIFCAQGAQLIAITATEGYSAYPCSLLWAIIPAAILGSIFGGFIYKKSSDKNIRKILIFTMTSLLALNINNFIVAL